MSARDHRAATHAKRSGVRDHRDPGVAWLFDEPGADEWVITVMCCQTGDTAYCDDADAVAVTARQLCDDAWDANPVQGFKPTVNLIVGRGVVAVGVDPRILR